MFNNGALKGNTVSAPAFVLYPVILPVLLSITNSGTALKSLLNIETKEKIENYEKN